MDTNKGEEMSTTLTSEQLAELADAVYGAPGTLKLDDGRLLRCKVENDDMSVMDESAPGGDGFYGAFAWVETDRYYGRDKPRPDGFTGKARKMSTSRGDSYWWEPPSGDYELATAEDVDKFAAHVRDLVEYGFYGVVVELCDGLDCYGPPIVVDGASL